MRWPASRARSGRRDQPALLRRLAPGGFPRFFACLFPGFLAGVFARFFSGLGFGLGLGLCACGFLLAFVLGTFVQLFGFLFGGSGPFVDFLDFLGVVFLLELLAQRAQQTGVHQSHSRARFGG